VVRSKAPPRVHPDFPTFGYFASGIFFPAIWLVRALTPVFDGSHQVVFCGKLNCSRVPPGYFLPAEVVLAVAPRAPAIAAFLYAVRGARRQG
jgi:hypothetical protein